MFSKRQLARMGLGEPDKYKHFPPTLSRKEMGSFADEYVAEAFDVEVRPLSLLHARLCGCCRVFLWLLPSVGARLMGLAVCVRGDRLDARS
jgi:hypothetical protein